MLTTKQQSSTISVTKIAVTLLASLLLIGCGSDSDSDDPPPISDDSTPLWTNTEAQMIVSTGCANSGCHGGVQLPNMTNFSQADFVGYKNGLALTRIQATDGTIMPPVAANFPLSAEQIANFASIFP